MKASQLILFLFATHTIAVSIPDANNEHAALDARVPVSADIVSPDHTLERRKGGGGRGGGSSGGGGGRTSGGSSGGASRGGGSSGTGPPRGLAGGRYYGGGAATTFPPGRRTPRGLVAGAIIAPVALLAIMPGLWLYSAYPYYYNNPYRFYNQSANATDGNNNNDRRELWIRQTTGRNETLPVMCLCGENGECGCDENDDPAYIDELVKDGSYEGLNKTLVTVADVNGTKTLVLNGTLPPGTSAPGEGGAAGLALSKYAGYYAVGLAVIYGVFM